MPTDDQKKLKAMFWNRWVLGPVRTEDEITAASVAHITDSSAVEKWWKDTAFRAWFKNNNTMSEDIDHNANIAVETLRQLMYDENPSIRLKAASESLKAKAEKDKEQARKESEGQTVDPENLQKLLNSALAAGIIKLPGNS